MMNFERIRFLAAVALAVPALAGCDQAAAASGGQAAAPADAQTITVYATPTCGCCKGWMDHLTEHGYTVETVYLDDLSAIRREHRVPARVTSCHMGVIDGYAVEGHVPADVIARMLRERPQIAGIAAPGMPLGSPGMEMPDGTVEPYDVVSFDARGATAVYEHVD